MARSLKNRVKRLLTAAEFEEILRCRQSPAYFINNYCYLKDPSLGRIPFSLFQYQEILLNIFLANAFNIILKPRQMGISWLVCAYALWLCLFFTDKEVLMISIKDETAKRLLGRFRYIYNHLPEFLQAELVENNTRKMAFCNGCVIQSVPTSPEAGRSESLSLLIIDEAAYIRWMESIWTTAYPTLSTGGQAIVFSTPNVLGNFFADKWAESVEGQSMFTPSRLHWYFYPGRDQTWFEIQKRNMSSLQFAQEVLGDFISTSNLVFDITSLRALQDECAMISPIEIEYEENDPENPCGLYIFEQPHPNENYILSVDTAKGGAADYNAAHITCRGTGYQMAEYRTKAALELFNSRILQLGHRFNNALAAIENNNMGIATNLYFKSMNYPSLYEHTDPKNRSRKVDLGFPTNTMTKPLLITELDTSIREGVSGVRGIRTVNELMNFAWITRGGSVSAQALQGKKDDLVMSYGIGKYVRKMVPVEYTLPIVYA